MHQAPTEQAAMSSEAVPDTALESAGRAEPRAGCPT